MLNELYTLTNMTDFPIHLLGDVYNGGTYNGEGVYSSHSSSPSPSTTTPPATASSGNPPTTLNVTGVDASPYMSTLITKTGSWPTFTGTAPPNSTITITFTFNSVVRTCKTTADSNGNWSCTLTQALSPGIQHVEITAVTPSGQVLSLPSFDITVVTSSTGTAQKTAPKVIPPKTDLTPIIWGLIIAAIAIFLLVLILLKRRKKKEQTKQPPQPPMQSGLIQ